MASIVTLTHVFHDAAAHTTSAYSVFVSPESCVVATDGGRSLEIVARSLKDQAFALGETDDAALFGRSAFNRYYYAAFLNSRMLLIPVFPDLPRQHAAIPDYLDGSVRRDLGRRKSQARRAGDHASMQLAHNARHAAADLASLLRVGYGARVVADYHPETPVSFYERGFKLNEVGVSEAETWPHKSKHFATLIVTAVKQTNVY